ncbi:MAG: oxidoreductase [Actinomycetota bacterium]|jgi:propanol-preferring alcohol dehydrogenase|nr:MAG: oxidoreductase [Actinomycetota bacterium]
MKALQLTAWQQGPELVDVPEPEPGPGEVVIKVGGAGACHSDLHVMEWPPGLLDWKLPFTLGHETAGWVHAIGSGVDGLREGDAVLVYGPWGDGRCRTCRLGSENYCEHASELGAAGGGLGRDGGMAEYMLVPRARWLVPIGDLDPVEAAPLADAGLTPYHAIKRSLHLLGPGSTVVVIGVGGLGHAAIQLVKALSPARVVAVDLAEAKLDLARRLGADLALPSDDEAVGTIRGYTGGRGAEVVLDLVGSDPTLALGAKVASVNGHLTVVGLGGGRLEFSFFALPYECSVATTYWGSVTELMEVVELARLGKLVIQTHRFPLSEATAAYQRMREGSLEGRAVIVP